MSEERDEHAEMQRMTSPELRLLDLIDKLEHRITREADRAQTRADFILEQQAELTAKIGALTDAQQRAHERWERTEGSIRMLLAAAEIQAGEIRDLSESVRAVDARTRHTDERLDALINTVERYISERRNGPA